LIVKKGYACCFDLFLSPTFGSYLLARNRYLAWDTWTTLQPLHFVYLRFATSKL